ncbi:LysR substrate-binding domain-containing protein [uncultured Pseudomonas sp.]|uniref:LysR substrate-binding domain-containing protein n=1 Tax=uncultured Pseudomonas sp. TaxID=114707 RepID=UPI003449E6DF
MFDLNDLYYFVQVVDCQGFTPAARKLGIPKSRLSRRVSGLEERLGVRLIQRSTRKFSVTESGRTYYGHCMAMLVEAEAAEESMLRSRAEPQGKVSISCPPLLASIGINQAIARYMATYPKVQVHVESSNRRVDPLVEPIDIALRVRFPPLEDDGLVVKVLGRSAQTLVAHPQLAARLEAGAGISGLAALPSVAQPAANNEHHWRLREAADHYREVRHDPRLVSSDLHVLHQAALTGVGVAQLPDAMIQQDLLQGRLVELFPEHPPACGIVHAVFASRRGLLPAVRGLLDAFAEQFESIQENCSANGTVRRILRS